MSKENLLFITLLTSIFTFALTYHAHASHPLQAHCSTSFQPLEFWIEKYDSIVVGEVLKVKPAIIGRPFSHTENLEPDDHYDTVCWGLFSVSEWLKGTGPKKIWIMSAFVPNPSVSEQELGQLKFCEFEKGRTYIAYGRYSKGMSSAQPAEMLVTASTKKIFSPSNMHCAPNTELHLGNRENILHEVKGAIKKQKEKPQ